MEKLILIDANAVIHRAYHALPPLKTKKGELVNAVYGFATLLLRVVKEFAPSYLICAFDLAGPTFRQEEYADYKAKRVKPAQDLYDQIPVVKELAKAFNVCCLAKQGFEADDILGTIAAAPKLKKEKIASIIVTGDCDLLQLIDENTQVYLLKRGIKEIALCDKDYVVKRYQFEPKQLIDFKGLRGDASDNIIGVPGIGEKIATNLIKEFGDLDNLYEKIEEADLNPKLRARLLEYKDQALLSRRLATIKKDVVLEFDFKKCRWPNFDKAQVVAFLEKLEFWTLINRLPQ